MLAPEVWNFRHKENSDHYKHNVEPDRVKNFIESSHYAHMVCVIMPCLKELPIQIHNSLQSDCEYYEVIGLEAAEIFSYAFIECFIKKGTITALTNHTLVDSDNCIAAIISGRAIFKLRRDLYFKLGIEGRPSHFSSRNSPEYFIVDINLNADNGLSTVKKYMNYKTRFADCGCKFNMLMVWEPPDAEICPSSIALYFSKCGYKVNTCYPFVEKKVENDVILPSIQETDLQEVFEWFGGLLLGIKKLHINDNQELPWIGIHILGFEDTPVSFGFQEHNFSTNGDNLCTVLIHRDGKCTLYSSHSKRVKMKIK